MLFLSQSHVILLPAMLSTQIICILFFCLIVSSQLSILQYNMSKRNITHVSYIQNKNMFEPTFQDRFVHAR